LCLGGSSTASCSSGSSASPSWEEQSGISRIRCDPSTDQKISASMKHRGGFTLLTLIKQVIILDLESFKKQNQGEKMSTAKDHFLQMTSPKKGEPAPKNKNIPTRVDPDHLASKIRKLTSCPPPGLQALYG